MKILLADDDQDLVDLLRHAFQRDGYKVVTALDGDVATRLFQLESPDLVILDLNMPKRSGMDVLRDVTRHSNTPVMVLSVMQDEDKVVEALDIGADEYLFKPFRLRELRARTRALLRRSRSSSQFNGKQLSPTVIGDIRLMPRAHEVSVAGQPVRLTPTEFALLQFLVANHDIIVSPSDIVANVWSYDANDTGEMVRVFISRLRRKIEADPSHPSYIINVPGVGYKFESKPS